MTLSFPRLRRAAGGIEPPCPVSDADLVQMMCALRIALPDVGQVLSTREGGPLRDRLVRISVTQMSAGSRTQPGGYLQPRDEGDQFAVEDRRNPDAVAAALREAGYDPVWKDWDPILSARTGRRP